MMSPEAQATVARFRAAREKKNPAETLAERRSRLKALLEVVPFPEGTTTQWMEIRGVPVQKICCPNTTEDKIIYFIHGGGFTVGSPATGRNYYCRLAQMTGRVVYAIDYRLAPEHPYPAALEDCAAVYQGLLEMGFAAEDIAVSGCSAGGSLSLALAHYLKDHQIPRPSCLAVHSPSTRLYAAFSEELLEKDCILSRAALETVPDEYAPGEDLTNPYISPAEGDFTEFPPTFIQVATDEALYPDSLVLAEKLKEANVSYELKIAEGMFHSFATAITYVPESVQTTRDAADFILLHG